MRKVCPNLDREDGLDTVLEVPVPELHQEVPARRRRRRTVKAWMRSHMHIDHHHMHHRDGVQVMLGVMGAPLVPQPVQPRRPMGGRDSKEEPLELSKARYIVEQYVAAAGGEAALSAATSMFAMGKVRMSSTTSKSSKATKKGMGEVHGGFVVWQKKPELWCVEMVMAGGTKMSAGSDGKVAWRQTPWQQQAHASRGPPRLIRRCVQGLDPKSTADLFSSAASAGEEAVDGEDCFVLRVDAEPSALHARSSADVEVIRHALWGYFSQRTGLLVRLEDSHLLRIPRPADAGGEGKAASASMYWETAMASTIGDYRPLDGINIAHAGRTIVSVSPFTRAAGAVDDVDADARRKRPCTCMEETWSIEEVEFNIAGLSTECFLPPRDLLLSDSKEQPRHNKEQGDKAAKGARDSVKAAYDSDGGCGIRAAVPKKALVPVVTGLGWFGPAKVAAVDSLDAADESKDATYASTR
ncbi:hypothetical protein CFC21_006199 [Triticum aestivum]|uniref:DUF569 domain-containing protein n=2 Tax=Triticum aestivum TaxID=4565 RepID=A0A9R1IQ77_WHEAT|nr:uncharacterized protein LOC123117775 [Triticum aestivum]KAF6988727.1 hypothetical protein CFC21_006199 [Triticum aestivum]